MPSHHYKPCAACRQFLRLFDFGKDASRPDGLLPYCRPCRNASHRQRRRKSGSQT